MKPHYFCKIMRLNIEISLFCTILMRLERVGGDALGLPKDARVHFFSERTHSRPSDAAAL